MLSTLLEDISLKFDMIYYIVLKSKPSCQIDFLDSTELGQFD